MAARKAYPRCYAAQEHADNDEEAVPAAPESDEGLMGGQLEVMTPGPTKEPRPVQDADGSPEVSGTAGQCLITSSCLHGLMPRAQLFAQDCVPRLGQVT